MTLLYVEGFDDGLMSLGKWTTVANTPTITATPRTGTNGCQFNSGSDILTKIVASADEHATFAVGFALRSEGTTPPLDILRFCADAGATTHISLGVTPSYAIEVRRGVAGTILGASDSGVISQNNYAHIECLVTLHDSTGVITVKVNGVTVISLTGQDTKNAGTDAVFDSFKFAGLGVGATVFVIDDIYLSNGAGSVNVGLLGDCAVVTGFPNANGSTSELLGSDGNSVDNYLLVDEVTPNTSDYVGSSTDGQEDDYPVTALAAGYTVRGVQHVLYAAKSDAGAKSMRHLINDDTFVGADFALTTTYAAYLRIWELEPSGAVTWTPSNFNTSVFGLEVRT